jgi:four helix bundle protein
VPSNIAEGAAKLGPRELRRFLDLSLGSLSELSYLLLFGRDRQLIDTAEWQRLDALRKQAGKLIWGLYRWAQRRSEGGKE